MSLPFLSVEPGTNRRDRLGFAALKSTLFEGERALHCREGQIRRNRYRWHEVIKGGAASNSWTGPVA